MKVWSLVWEDPLEKGTETHSSILAWRIPWTEEPGGLQSLGSQWIRQDWSDFTKKKGIMHFHLTNMVALIAGNDIYKLIESLMVAQTVKHLPAMQETWVQSPGKEDALEKEMAIHSSTLAWKIPWMEEPGRLQLMRLQRVGHKWATSLTKECE